MDRWRARGAAMCVLVGWAWCATAPVWAQETMARGDEKRQAPVLRPTTFSVLSRLVSELETTLAVEADDSLGRAEREILDLDLPLPSTEDLVEKQMNLDRRFARLRYMTQALEHLGALESARNAFREERFRTRLANLRRVRESFDAIAGAQEARPRELPLVVFEPDNLSLGLHETVQGVTVRALGSSVRLDGMRIEQTERDTPGLVMRQDGCGPVRLLLPGDRCAVTLEWNGRGPVPDGVLVSEVAPGDPDAPAMRQTHAVAFGPGPEVAAMMAARTVELAEVVQEMAGAYQTLQSEIAQLADESTADRPTFGEFEEIVGLQTEAQLAELEARIGQRIEALQPAPVDDRAQDERSLPRRVHVAAIQRAGDRAEAHVEIAQPQRGRFASSLLLRVREGDAIGQGWTVRAVQAARRRIVLAHPDFGEDFAYARVFSPAAFVASPVEVQGQDQGIVLPPGFTLPEGFSLPEGLGFPQGLAPAYGLPGGAAMQ